MNHEQEVRRSAQASRKFVAQVSEGLQEGNQPWMTFAAIDLLSKYYRDPHLPFAQYIQNQTFSLLPHYGEDTYSITTHAQRWFTLLTNSENSQNRTTDTWDTFHLWKDIGTLLAKKETRDIAQQLSQFIGQAEPDKIQQIMESVLARLTLGELIAKPAMILAASAAIIQGIPVELKTDPLFYILPTITLMLAWIKTEQDIHNFQIGAPFITFETCVCRSVLKFHLRKSAYFVRLAWLLPVFVPSLLAHIHTDADVSNYFFAQSLIYLGEFSADAFLALKKIKNQSS